MKEIKGWQKWKIQWETVMANRLLVRAQRSEVIGKHILERVSEQLGEPCDRGERARRDSSMSSYLARRKQHNLPHAVADYHI